MFERAGPAVGPLPGPFPNEQAARAANGGAVPPDLSLMAKARTLRRGFPWFLFDVFTQYQEQGPDYFHALLTGYEEPPAGFDDAAGHALQPVFPGPRDRACRSR